MLLVGCDADGDRPSTLMDGSPAHGPRVDLEGVSSPAVATKVHVRTRPDGRDEVSGRVVHPRARSADSPACRRRRAGRRGELDRHLRVRLRPARLRQQPREAGRRPTLVRNVVRCLEARSSRRPAPGHCGLPDRLGCTDGVRMDHRRSSSTLSRGRAGGLLRDLRAGRRSSDPDRHGDRDRGRRARGRRFGSPSTTRTDGYLRRYALDAVPAG